VHPRARRKLIIGAVVALLAVVAVALYFTVFRKESKPEKGIASVEKQTISVNGVDLAAEIITPRGVAHPPLLVMPGSFRGSAASYHPLSLLFGRAGYEVVAYGQRGFGGSTGKVDFAGPATQRDAREVITWALEHTNADPKRIAMLGTSYGAGISLLTAAHDSRVRAVAALSTWTDFADAYLDSGTPHILPLRSVLGGTSNASDYDPELRHLQSTLLDHPADLPTVLHAMSAVRSPDTYVKQLNANNPAIMIANAFQDSYFQPAQLISFVDQLKTPKRLELGPGDHGGPERSSLEGVPNEIIDDVLAWFAHYLRGADNGIQHEDPIVAKDSRTGELRALRSWPVPTKKQCAPLDKPGVLDSTGVPTNTWVATIPAGTDSGADAAPIQLVQSPSYRPAKVKLNTLAPDTTFTWTGPELANGLELVGTPSLTINLASSSPTATLYLYLYDVSPDGTGTLIDLQAYTATGLNPSDATHLSIPMQPMAWSVPSGNHVALVVDTADPRFLSLTPPNTTITVTSSKKRSAAFCAPTAD
jgi:predicted acyl esterase